MSSSSASTERARAPGWLRALGNSVFFYPLLMHFLIINDQFALALAGLAATSLIAALISLQQPHARVQAALYFFIALAALIGLGGANEMALYLPPVVFNCMFAVVFMRTLRPGATPLIERFMRVYHGDSMPLPVLRYARQLTWIWTGLFVAAAIAAALLAVFADIETWSLFANVVNYLLVVALFIGQFLYGAARFGLLRPMQIVPTLVRVAHRATRRGFFGR
jgi:uncharacterized membrane protein